ncbi:helix-turn-helix domain-containing protein [Peribacillus sp. SCS-26]|uniref:helix-turn-helix domain-containing protein n=1 Tax=Paraperibacillus marinus TaxID=3115295 RepID=UPI0039068B8E
MENMEAPLKNNNVPVKEVNDYPVILTAEHVAEILNISKQVAYEVMERKGFPLIRVGRFKRVQRESFFSWLLNKAN